MIACVAAGFEATVAPLGTALTEDQLRLLWQMADEPVLCFDGDEAGLKAAFRAVDTALPQLKPGKSLSFALLPEGQDPTTSPQGGAGVVPQARSRRRSRWSTCCGCASRGGSTLPRPSAAQGSNRRCARPWRPSRDADVRQKL